MTYVICASCGQRLMKGQATVSKFTNSAWCRDERACQKRAAIAIAYRTKVARR